MGRTRRRRLSSGAVEIIRRLRSLEIVLAVLVVLAASLIIAQEMLAFRGTSIIDKAVQKLKELNINLLAIDFDQTLIDIHTGGRWKGSFEELKEHVRPEFQQLLMACTQNGIQVAIVTFSQQPKLIKSILETMVGPEHAARIPVRGEDRSWTYNGVGSRDGKQAHIASAAEELEQSGEFQVTKSSTVLIDDDHKNVRHALSDGTRAVWFNPEKPHHLLRDLSKLV